MQYLVCLWLTKHFKLTFIKGAKLLFLVLSITSKKIVGFARQKWLVRLLKKISGVKFVIFYAM